MRKMILALALLVALLLTAAIFWRTGGTNETYPNRDPTGERFPAAVGESLEKESTVLPTSLAGEPAIVLVGYAQRAQFDIDRWLMGLIQAEASATILEVPTIPGLAASFASDWIDDGMRSGIPREDWGSVVTLYGSAAEPVARLTGTENGRLTRVLVLDADGTIVWFDDEGYSARKAMAVAELIRETKMKGRGAPDTE